MRGAVEHVLAACSRGARSSELRMGLAQILGDIGHPVVLRLDDLQSHLADRLAGARDSAGDIAELPSQARRGALDLEHARALRQPFFEQEVIGP